MTDTRTEDTERIARRYFDAWTSRDAHATAGALDPAFRFTAGDLAIEGRKVFAAFMGGSEGVGGEA